jgi:hypothetical protein
MQTLGGTGDRAFLGDRLKYPQLAEFHCFLLNRTSYSLLFNFKESQSILA